MAGLGLLLSAEPAWAWGPGAHIFLGREILGALSLLPAGIAALLRLRPYDFLYGCVAADITLGKKYAPAGRHCHHWHVANELREAADSPATRAFALGYLTHLAADTTAHNFYVPRRLLTSAQTHSFGHSYWEHRIDAQLGEEYLRAARRLVLDFDHAHNDALLDRILDPTVFSFQTNRRIFRGMIRVTGHDTWHALFVRVIDLSRWDVDDAEALTWMAHTLDYTLDYLIHGNNSIAVRLDPTGEERLSEARRLRRAFATSKRRDELERLAARQFALPYDRPGWSGLRDSARGVAPSLLIEPECAALPDPASKLAS